MKAIIHVGTITKAEQLKTALGHQPHVTGTGAWRNRKRQPKGGRRAWIRQEFGRG